MTQEQNQNNSNPETNVDLAFLTLLETFEDEAKEAGCKLAHEAVSGDLQQADYLFKRLAFLRHIKEGAERLWGEWRDRPKLLTKTGESLPISFRAADLEEEKEFLPTPAEEARLEELLQQAEREEEPVTQRETQEAATSSGIPGGRVTRGSDISHFRLPVLMMLYALGGNTSPISIRRALKEALPELEMTHTEMLNTQRFLIRHGYIGGGHGMMCLTTKGRELVKEEVKKAANEMFLPIFKGT